jgi:hypothetical protein
MNRATLTINLNFTKTYEDVELNLINSVNPDTPEYIDPETNIATIIFTNNNDKINFRAEPPYSESLIKGMVTTGSTFGDVAGAAGTIGFSVAMIASFFNMPAMGFLVKFLIMFKILDRLKLLNVYFGPLLGGFLDAIGNILNLTSGTGGRDRGFRFDTKTRGKITQYKLDNLALYHIPMKYAIYIATWFLDMPRIKIWRYAKSLDNMGKADRAFCLVAEKIRFLIFTSFISDIALFSLNELIHHDLTVPNQVAYSNISYSIVFIVFCLGVYDVMKLLGIIDTYKKRKSKKRKNGKNGL